MADLGDLLGSLMTSLIRARRMADEQTAALAEHYKENPLLEGLSVPRIRIPELIIDMPFLIENQIEGDSGEMADTAAITSAATEQIISSMDKENATLPQEFNQALASSMRNKIDAAKKIGAPAMKETVARSVQDAFAETISKAKVTLTKSQMENISRDLRAKLSETSIKKAPVASSVIANIKTADVKERASATSVVRLKITLKEEGLEWATQTSESGGVIRTLQPE